MNSHKHYISICNANEALVLKTFSQLQIDYVQTQCSFVFYVNEFSQHDGVGKRGLDNTNLKLFFNIILYNKILQSIFAVTNWLYNSYMVVISAGVTILNPSTQNDYSYSTLHSGIHSPPYQENTEQRRQN